MLRTPYSMLYVSAQTVSKGQAVTRSRGVKVALTLDAAGGEAGADFGHLGTKYWVMFRYYLVNDT